MKKAIAGLAIGLILGGSASASSLWAHFDREGSGKVQHVVVKARCLGAEDSAGHLRLVVYGDGTAKYDCSVKLLPACRALTAWADQVASEHYRKHYRQDVALAREGRSLACTY